MKVPDNLNLTREQENEICYRIGMWYMFWKPQLVDYKNKTHKLGMAKEDLKTLLCDSLITCDDLICRSSKKQIDKEVLGKEYKGEEK